MESKDDDLYSATVRQTPKLAWGGKPQAPNRRRDPRRAANLRRQITNQNLWVLPGPDELR